MMRRRHGVAGIAILALTAAAGAWASSGSETPVQAPAAVARQSAHGMLAGPIPGDAEIKDFVAASLAAQKIDVRAQQRYDAASSDAEREKLRQTTDAEIRAVLRKHHLTMERYHEIYADMRVDEGLHIRVETLVQQQLAAQDKHS